MKKDKFRIAIFGDSASRTCSILCKGLAEYLRADKRVKVVVVVDSGEGGLLPILASQSFGWSLLRYVIGKVFGNPVVWDHHGDFLNMYYGNFWEREKWYRGGKINKPGYIRYFKKLKLDGTICIGTPYKFSPELLSVLGYCVNYHDSYLPEYAGRGATKLAYLNGEKTSGFTFHKMVERCDAGNILCQGNYLVKDFSPLKIEVEKANRVKPFWPTIFTSMINGGEGIPQNFSKRTYYSYKHWLSAITVFDENEDVQRILDIFGYVRTLHNGQYVYVTSLNPLRIFYLPIHLWDIVSKFLKVKV